jgi:hypothetical protein
MKMFGGLTKTSSRIAIAAALGMTLGGFALHASPAKAADLGGDCCADLEERVAELEATTVRKGNKKVSVTLSGWVVKLGSWWDDGDETNFYTGDKDTTLSSHFQLSGSAQIAPGWSAGYTIAVEVPGNSASVGFAENQFNDNAWNFSPATVNTLLSYMWLKSDRWGTVNWGQLSQATDNVALLPDLSGTIIEANAVMFDGAGMYLRAKGAKGADGLATAVVNGQKWISAVTCINGGGGVGADCNGYPYNGFRYDTPTWWGFSASGGYYEDDVWDVALKYAADWNSVKFSAAVGYTQTTDEGCTGIGSSNCFGGVAGGGGGAPFQGARRDVNYFQVGASIMHVPSGLFVYGMWANENNNGTQLGQNIFTPLGAFGAQNFRSTAQNDNDVWYLKAGIKRTWSPIGATVLFGEYGQYNDQYSGLCGTATACFATFQVGASNDPRNFVTGNITGSEVQRWGLGVVQEVDSAAMHLFARWQHQELDLSGQFINDFTGNKVHAPGFEDQNIYQVGGVIFF